MTIAHSRMTSRIGQNEISEKVATNAKKYSSLHSGSPIENHLKRANVAPPMNAGRAVSEAISALGKTAARLPSFFASEVVVPSKMRPEMTPIKPPNAAHVKGSKARPVPKVFSSVTIAEFEWRE
jgi:hypothetical protein